jgi:predicted MPP superfamily phosphohydrolase
MAALGWFAWRNRAWRRPLVASLALLGVGYLLCVWTFLVEPKTLRVHRLEVASAGWTAPPLRIGVVSDTHVGAPHVDVPRLRATLQRLNQEKPDLIVFLGDYAGGHEPAATRAAPDRSLVLQGVASLATAQAPLGEVAVLGNHDWWYDGPAIRAPASLGWAGGSGQHRD